MICLCAPPAAATLEPAPPPQVLRNTRDDAVTDAAGDTDALLQQGWSLIQRREYQQARAIFDAAIRRAPERADAYVGLGESLFWLGDFDRAIDAYRAALSRDHKITLAHNGIGHASLNLATRSGREYDRRQVLLNDAVTSFQAAVDLDPAFAPPRDGLRWARQLLALSRAAITLEPLPIFVASTVLCILIMLGWNTRHWRPRSHCSDVVAVPGLRVPVLAFVASRLFIVAVMFVAPALLLPPASHPLSTLPRPDSWLLDVLGGRWDANFYMSIALDGYRAGDPPIPGDVYSITFFPLLPILMRAGMWIVNDPSLVGAIISNLALLGVTLLFYQLVRATDDEPTATRAVWYFLIFPASFFGSAVYSESLFLLGAVGALYAARQGSWALAALSGMLASLARPTGIIVAPMLAVEWWVQRRRAGDAPRPPGAALLAAVAAPLGSVAFMVYSYHAFGDPFAYSHRYLSRYRATMLGSIVLSQIIDLGRVLVVTGRVAVKEWIDVLTLIGFAWLGIVLLRRRRWAEGVFVMAGIIVSFGADLTGDTRYMWALFPAFIVLAQYGAQPWMHRALTAVFLLGLCVFTAMFACWYYVA